MRRGGRIGRSGTATKVDEALRQGFSGVGSAPSSELPRGKLAVYRYQPWVADSSRLDVSLAKRRSVLRWDCLRARGLGCAGSNGVDVFEHAIPSEYDAVLANP